MKAEEGYMTNLTKFYIVVLLHERPRHGYEIIDEIGKRIGKKPSAGQIYPLLKKLQKLGYVKMGVEKIGKKRKNVYKLTKEGKNFSSDIISRFSRTISSAIEKSIESCAHCGCEIYRGGFRQKIKGEIFIFCCKSCASVYDLRR